MRRDGKTARKLEPYKARDFRGVFSSSWIFQEFRSLWCFRGIPEERGGAHRDRDMPSFDVKAAKESLTSLSLFLFLPPRSELSRLWFLLFYFFLLCRLWFYSSCTSVRKSDFSSALPSTYRKYPSSPFALALQGIICKADDPARDYSWREYELLRIKLKIKGRKKEAKYNFDICPLNKKNYISNIFKEYFVPI